LIAALSHPTIASSRNQDRYRVEQTGSEQAPIHGGRRPIRHLSPEKWEKTSKVEEPGAGNNRFGV
jgi:hypothetical protein